MTYQEFEESNHAEGAQEMSDEGHGRTKHWEYGIKHGSKEDADDEQDEKDGRVPHDRTQ